MNRQTTVEITDAACRKACRRYAAELKRSGLVLEVRNAPADVQLYDEAPAYRLRVEWRAGADDDSPGDSPAEWETACEEGDDAYGNGLSPCVVRHYEQTLRTLGTNPEAAGALLARMRRSGRREKSKGGRA